MSTKATKKTEEQDKDLEIREADTWTPGRCYLVMTPTHYWTGRLAKATPTELVFVDAAWIPDTGRLNECLKNGTVIECEPWNSELVLTRSLCTGLGWAHALPRKVQ